MSVLLSMKPYPHITSRLFLPQQTSYGKGVYREDIDPEKASRVLLFALERFLDPQFLSEHDLIFDDVIEFFLRHGINK